MNGFRIENIAAQQSGGHFEMAGNQIAHRIGIGGIEKHLSEYFLDSLQASLDVTFDGHSFANIVEKKSEEKKLRLLKFAENFREFALPIPGGLAEALEIVDRLEGMLVDRVAVVEIANDQRIDAAKLAEERNEHAEPVQIAQGIGGARLEQNRTEPLPEPRKVEAFQFDFYESFLDVPFGFRAERQAVMRAEFE